MQIKKYEVVIHNSEAREDADTNNIQFHAGGKLCNFPPDKAIIISEAAYNNLKDSFQERWKPDPKDPNKMISYKFKRYPVTLIKEIIEEIPDAVIAEEKKKEEEELKKPIDMTAVNEPDAEEKETPIEIPVQPEVAVEINP